MLSSVPVGPSGGQVPCSACGAIIDPLRAGHVAIFNARFHYFCNHHGCRARFLGQEPSRPAGRAASEAAKPEHLDPVVQAVTGPVQGAEATRPPDAADPQQLPVSDRAELIEPLDEAPPPLGLPADEEPIRRDVGGLLVAITIAAGVLAVALDFAAPTRLLVAARAVLVLVGTGALCGRAFTTRPDAAEVHRLVVVVPPLLSCFLTAWAFVAADTATAARAAFFSGTIVTVVAANVWLSGLAARPVVATRRWLERQLDVPAQRVTTDAAPAARELTTDIAPGDHVVVQAGETVPVDLEVAEGEVEIVPWVGAAHRERRSPGQHVVGGARVTQGQLRGACTFAGMERALARPLLSPDRRCDVHARISQWARAVAQQWAWLAALAGGLATLLLAWSDAEGIAVAMVVVAIGTALGNVAVGTLPALSIARGVRAALSHGIVHCGARAWDRCGQVTTAVFCARGTVLRGEPELAEVETFSDRSDPANVLALAAGAVGVDRSPWAVAVRRGARSRSVAPEAIRNPRSLPGLGGTAVGPSGETLCVGNRALMVQRHVSVAAAERRMAELEALGRTVLLVSRAGRLTGLVALQDGLRPGARAAVQHVIDAGMEPVLISSDSTETCQALGRSLDIEHLRPEVPDAERDDAIERIKETGAVVAVLGHSPHDEAALRAADASVALAAAGSPANDFSAVLVSDDVRDAALALAIAQRTRRLAAQVTALVLAPALFGSLIATAGLLPPEYAALASLLGTVAAVVHLRSWDRAADRR